jgi:hypothetical protein
MVAVDHEEESLLHDDGPENLLKGLPAQHDRDHLVQQPQQPPESRVLLSTFFDCTDAS